MTLIESSERIYSARVPENAEQSALVIKVTANDLDEDSHLTYSIIDGNVGSAFEVVPDITASSRSFQTSQRVAPDVGGVFEVVPDIGEIKVRAALDYETGPRVC